MLITNGTQKVSEHVYDARGYRIRKDTYTDDELTESRHYYYTPGWQCVEERLGSTSTAERQFVWGLRYIDDLVLRDRYTRLVALLSGAVLSHTATLKDDSATPKVSVNAADLAQRLQHGNAGENEARR